MKSATRHQAICVDDEPGCHEALRALLRDVADIELTRTYSSPAPAMAALEKERFDLLFLDVAMPGLSGLDLLQALRDPPVTVLLTARAEHALSAFELGVRDYLLKPVSPERLQRCLERVRPLLQASDKASSRIALKCGTLHRLLDPKKISRVEAEGNFSVVHAEGERIFASEPLKDLERRFEHRGFVRIHKSHLVNASFVDSISAAVVRLRDGAVLPMGRSYQAAALEKLRA